MEFIRDFIHSPEVFPRYPIFMYKITFLILWHIFWRLDDGSIPVTERHNFIYDTNYAADRSQWVLHQQVYNFTKLI